MKKRSKNKKSSGAVKVYIDNCNNPSPKTSNKISNTFSRTELNTVVITATIWLLILLTWGFNIWGKGIFGFEVMDEKPSPNLALNFSQFFYNMGTPIFAYFAFIGIIVGIKRQKN